MREVITEKPQRTPVRAFVIPWIAGLLTWFVVTWGVDLIIGSASGTDNIGGVVTASWLGLLLAPMLTASVGVLLLPHSARGQVPSALIAGLPIVALIMVWRGFTVESQIGSAPILVGGLILLLIAAAASVGLALLARSRD